MTEARIPASRLSVRDRRALLTGSAIVVVTLLFSWVVRPSWQRRAQLAEQLVAERALVVRERQAIAAVSSKSGTDAPVDSIGRFMSSRLFSGRDDVIATASLAAYVAAVARAHEVWLQSATTRPASGGETSMRMLRVDIRAEGDAAGLLGLVQALEAGVPIARIERLDVTPASAPDDGTAPLTITATIMGFALPGDRPTGVDRAVHAPVAPSVAAESTIARFVARDPFAPDRTPPTVPYRVMSRGGTSAPDASATTEDAGGDAPLPLPSVHGTAVDGRGGGFAMVAVGSGPIVVVRIGDIVGAFTVLSIERERVVFRDAFGRRHIIDSTASQDGTGS